MFFCKRRAASVEKCIIDGGHGLRKLLTSRADPNEVNPIGFSALHRACDPKYINLEAVGILLEAKANVNLAGGPDKRTPLHKVLSEGEVKQGLSEVVTLLLHHRADVNAQTGCYNPEKAFWHQTPLHIAVRNGRAEAARMLLLAKADASLKAGTGLTALHMCPRLEDGRPLPEIAALFSAQRPSVPSVSSVPSPSKSYMDEMTVCHAIKPARRHRTTLVEKISKFEGRFGCVPEGIPVNVPPGLSGPLTERLLQRIMEQDWVIFRKSEIPDHPEFVLRDEQLLQIQRQAFKMKRSNADDKKCAACGIEGVQKCSICLQTYYCSRQCQQTDWKQHKKACVAPKPKITANIYLAMPEYDCFMEYQNWLVAKCKKDGEEQVPLMISNRNTFEEQQGKGAGMQTILHLIQHGKPYGYFDQVATK